VVAFILFLIVKAYNRYMARRDELEPATEVGLLTEIRDLLAQRQP
jgi:large-conductance mechanosensitive channel